MMSRNLGLKLTPRIDMRSGHLPVKGPRTTTRTHSRRHTPMHTHPCLSTDTQTQLHIQYIPMHTWRISHTHTNTHTLTHTQTHTHTYTHTLTHTHLHTHTWLHCR